MEQDRPIGISILSVVGFIVGTWQLLVAIVAISFTSSMVMISAISGIPPAFAPSYAEYGLGADLVAMGAAFAFIIGSIGLWSLQRWAYWLAVAGAALSLATHVLPRFTGFLNPTSGLSAALAAAILVYMFLPSVRRAFFETPASDYPSHA
jgi:hypothetical protein